MRTTHAIFVFVPQHRASNAPAAHQQRAGTVFREQLTGRGVRDQQARQATQCAGHQQLAKSLSVTR